MKILSRRKLLAVILGGFALFLIIFFYFVFEKRVEGDSTPLVKNAIAVSKPEQMSFGLPLRLKIPKINVSAAFEYVGLTSQGAMDVPKNPINVAWFDLGQRPGEAGSAVVAGHYGWKDGKASAFDNLYKLRKGDKLYVENDKGLTVSFVVREIKKYNYQADAPTVFGSSDGKSHLNLITCGGIWNKAKKSYSERLVVFADKE